MTYSFLEYGECVMATGKKTRVKKTETRKRGRERHDVNDPTISSIPPLLQDLLHHASYDVVQVFPINNIQSERRLV